MREIKFRAWDFITKKMRKVEAIHFNRNGEIEFIDIVPERRHEVTVRFPDQVVLMQYTGLKDLHGEEAYKGDIVTYDGDYWKIIWMEDDACFGMESIGGKITAVSQLYLGFDCEVIGNIYENPELLEENNE